MATINFTGLDSLVVDLEKLTAHTEDSMKRVVWAGGKVVGDNIRAALNNIPVQDYYVPEGTMRTGVSQEDKNEIISGFGMAKMRKEGAITTRAGFRTGAAGKMRKVESGTSYLRKHPIIRPAANRSKGAAETAMEQELIKEINKYMT